ncbi:methyltransferase domain-containing protein [Streptomonospora nanhaiensis]|uniref:methyltransferase domain-containing protein n=1 Tax=Streptomonospora nanhaiensis TaxID=1323731 RepID=UPI001C991B1D|nr:methyltransferase domain-containing protein [Streptomonospora nanhaiensis]MBX9387460.1 methyltransferase domain-containing protein [Streptomonospora nanhaiensis]
MAVDYVHGYSDHEARRLGDQADTLADLLHEGTAYAPGSRVLEAGCGVGAQTVHLLARSPEIDLTAVDRAADSLARARERVAEAAPGARVRWHQADLFDLPFPDAAFDHVFVCFVLEHVADPAGALRELGRVLRPGGTLTVVEGDHGSALFHPASPYAEAVVAEQVRLQAAAGGDALIGRRLQPLLSGAGFRDVAVRPRTVYADATRPALVNGFVRTTFTGVMAAVREPALAGGRIRAQDFDRGVADLLRTAEDGGTFHYTFFKAVALNPPRG